MQSVIIKVKVPKRFRKFGKLPGRPSELIRLALSDLKLVERKPNFKIEMNKGWYEVDTTKVCHVCFAGAVMAGTLKAKTDKLLKTEDVSDFDGTLVLYTDNYAGKEESALDALDCFRSGAIEDGFDCLGLDLPINIEAHIDVMPYYDNRLAFHRAMNKLANELESIGY